MFLLQLRDCARQKMTDNERGSARSSERHKGPQQTLNNLAGWSWASWRPGKLELNKHAPHDYNEPGQQAPKANNLCSCVCKHLLHHETTLYDGSKKNNLSTLEIEK